MTHPLTVYECTHNMARLGRPHDGGYVIAVLPHAVNGCPYDHFLSGGISDDNSFERDVLDWYPTLECFAFDPSSNGAVPHPRFHFTQEPLGYLGLATAKNALVKIDIERNEWPWFQGLLQRDLDHIAQLVIELHSPHVPEDSRWDWGALSWLAETHALVHLHANNWDGIVEVEGVRMPGTMECTYLRRDLAGESRLNRQGIPGPLDQSNDARIPDHVIDWEPFVWRT